MYDMQLTPNTMGVLLIGVGLIDATDLDWFYAIHFVGNPMHFASFRPATPQK